MIFNQLFNQLIQEYHFNTSDLLTMTEQLTKLINKIITEKESIQHNKFYQIENLMTDFHH